MSTEQATEVEALAAALAERLPVSDTRSRSEGGVEVDLAVHFGTRAGLIDHIVDIVQLTRVGDEERLRAAATEWHNALRNGRLYNGSCACARRTGEMCSLGAALAPQPPSPASQGEKR